MPFLKKREREKEKEKGREKEKYHQYLFQDAFISNFSGRMSSFCHNAELQLKAAPGKKDYMRNST